MLRLKIYENATYPEEKALVDVSCDQYPYNKIIISGDEYHDGIRDRIEGFFDALSYLKISYEKITTEAITPDNRLFEFFDFYDARENKYYESY